MLISTSIVLSCILSPVSCLLSYISCQSTVQFQDQCWVPATFFNLGHCSIHRFFQATVAQHYLILAPPHHILGNKFTPSNCFVPMQYFSHILTHNFLLNVPVSCLLSHVSFLTYTVLHLLSYISYLTSPVSCLLSHDSCLMFTVS